MRKTIDYVPRRKQFSFFGLWAIRCFGIMAALVGVEIMARAFGPNFNNINVAAFLFWIGLICVVASVIFGRDA